ncbi:hypothetical protein [uncultured Mucilaginibacter sp.]|uniref:hypothetical protein n=1 Tax=uncultured Mucilaginibacter sp. TaxID=797541 RepID=UPI0025E35024|nr:hypothetical protein [uncultured Mucilaginibacter sp.]
MVAIQPYIIYKLPLTRIFQAIKGGKIEKAWDNIKYFIEVCTNVDIHQPTSIEINGFSADRRHGELPEPAVSLLERIVAHFGVGDIKPLGYHVYDKQPTEQNKTEWKLTPADLSDAIEFMVAGQPYPKYNLGPIELILSYDFKLINLDTRIELTGQQYTSMLIISLSRNNSVCPSLCFPFTEPNDDFWKYFDKIKELAPFKMDTKDLRLVRSNKKRTTNVFSKIKLR